MQKNEESENEINTKVEGITKRRRRKPKKKTRFTIKCPFCSCSNTVFISAQQFQLKQIQCTDEECNEEFWVQIQDNLPSVTKSYPYARKRKKSQSEFIDSDLEIIAGPRKKRNYHRH